ncbi:unnamed protein product [Caenorhabditis brenneri]
MDEKGMNYPSLRILLEYLEANKRIELVRRCPSLKHVDKAIPISMSYLYLDETRVFINTTTYDVGVIRQYPKNDPKILKEYQRRNDDNGAAYDLNQYGRRDRSGNQVIYAGDVVIPTSYNPIVERTDEEEELYMEQLKARLAQLKRLRRMKQRQQEKERIEALIYEWTLQKDNSHPSYSMYLQYTHTKSDKTKIIERLEYNRKLYEAAKFMLNGLFAGRKHPIRVDCLDIAAIGGVLRLPSNFKVNARKLTTGFNFTPTMKSIGSLLVDRSIRDISVIGGTRAKTTYNRNSTIKSADYFAICSTPVTGNKFQLILKNRNLKLHVSKGKITKDEYLTLFDNMRTVERKIGTTYSFGVHSKKLLKSFFDALKQRDGVSSEKLKVKKRRRFPFSYRARKGEKSTVSVHCTRNTQYNEKTRTTEPWTLWLQIIKTVETVEENVERGKKDFVKLIDELISTKREIGTSDSFEIHSKKTVKEVFDAIRKRDGATFRKEEKRGCTRFPYTYNLPIEDHSKLVILCNRNKSSNKKGNEQKPWTIWFFVEKVGEMAIDEYKKFLDKIISDKKKIGTNYLVAAKTKNQVKELLGEVRNRDGVSIRNLKNRGCSAFPNTYYYFLNDSSKLTIFCEKKKDYNPKDPADQQWILRHCIERVDKKKVVEV